MTLINFVGCVLREDVLNLKTGEIYPYMVLGEIRFRNHNFSVYDVYEREEDARRRFNVLLNRDNGMGMKDYYRAFKGTFCSFKDTFRVRGYRVGEYYELTGSGFARYVVDPTEEERVYRRRYHELQGDVLYTVCKPLDELADLVLGDLDESPIDEEKVLVFSYRYNKYLDAIGGVEGEEAYVQSILEELSDLRGDLGIGAYGNRVSSIEKLYVTYRSKLNDALEKVENRSN